MLVSVLVTTFDDHKEPADDVVDTRTHYVWRTTVWITVVTTTFAKVHFLFLAHSAPYCVHNCFQELGGRMCTQTLYNISTFLQ